MGLEPTASAYALSEYRKATHYHCATVAHHTVQFINNNYGLSPHYTMFYIHCTL